MSSSHSTYTGRGQWRGRLAGLIWLGALSLGLLLAGQTAYRQTLQVQEYAKGCDPFGYLQMAQEIRLASAQHRLPNFHLASAQSNALSEMLRREKLPAGEWLQAVAPQAHLYFPIADAVGVQYPPGTGMLLAMFSPGKAVRKLNNLVIIGLVLAGLGLLAAAARYGAWRSAGSVALVVYLGLTIVGRIGIASFSINALLLPLFGAMLFSCLATGWEPLSDMPRRAITFAGAAGLLFGFCILIRLPTLFLLPGLLLLYTPWMLTRNALRRTAAFIGGVIIAGFVPLLWHQQRVAGAWNMSTYSQGDNLPPSLVHLTENWQFYFSGGQGSLDNWGIFWLIPGILGGTLLLNGVRRSLMPALAAGFIVWLLPVIYFMTHRVHTQYYLTPSIFGAAALLALALWRSETRAASTSAATLRGWQLLLAGLALLPGLVVLAVVWRSSAPRSAVPAATELIVPADLSDPQAWIWSDELSGSFAYYARHPAFKIDFTSPRVRARIFRFVYERNEPQYIVQDSSGMQSVMSEIGAAGGELEERGTIGGYRYFQIRWSPDGPR